MILPDGRWFRASEFACHDGTPFPEEWDDRFAKLVALCDDVRDEWNGPLMVVSGYRTPAHNLALIEADEAKGAHGVASGSRHVEGMAADLRPVGGGDASQLYRVIMAALTAGSLQGLGGLGFYPSSNWCHVDTFQAPDGHLRKWLGT